MDVKQIAAMGGNARAKKLSPRRRKEIALLGVVARQKKRQAEGVGAESREALAA